MEWLDKARAAILNLIAHREVAAVVLGFLASVGVTQAVKEFFADTLTRRRAQALSIALGCGICFWIFPPAHGPAMRVGFAVVVGLLSPLAYKLIKWGIGLKWPQLAERASADL